MIKRIIAGGLVGWAGIVALAWWLAQMRIEICDKASATAEASCAVRATAARDHVLTSGLTVALIGAVVAAFAWSVIRSRNGNQRAVIEARPPRASDLTRAASPVRLFGWRRRQPHVRVVLAMAFGMILTAGLLWWSGMIRPSPREEWERSPLAEAANPYADIPPKKTTTGSKGWRGDPIFVPVKGDPFADIPTAQSLASTEGGQGATPVNADAPATR